MLGQGAGTGLSEGIQCWLCGVEVRFQFIRAVELRLQKRSTEDLTMRLVSV